MSMKATVTRRTPNAQPTMNEITQVPTVGQLSFDYNALPVATALEVRAAAERIKVRMKRTVEDIIEIGRELTAVKDRLEHGQFLPWIKAEFDMSADTAHRMINVAARFGQIPQIAEFKPSILYALAAPSTPAAVIDQALEKAESGEPVTLADVQDWKAKAADLELALKEQTETIDFFKQQAYRTGDELATARRRIAELEEQPVKEVPPADYDRLKADLETLKAQQVEIIQQQVIAKLTERQAELEALEEQRLDLEKRIAQARSELTDEDQKKERIKAHQSQIDSELAGLADLAIFLTDLAPIEDHGIIRQWHALASQHGAAAEAIKAYLSIQINLC